MLVYLPWILDTPPPPPRFPIDNLPTVADTRTMGDPDQMLNELASVQGGAIAKISYTHDGMIDLIVANPMISQGELAAHFGYSPAWISRVIASDAFQSRLALRREEVLDPTIKATIEERFKALVLRSLDILQEKLSQPAGLIPDNLALRTTELASKALGYGAKQDPQTPAPTYDRLEQLGERLVGLLDKQKRSVLDGQAEEVSDGVLVPTKEG